MLQRIRRAIETEEDIDADQPPQGGEVVVEDHKDDRDGAKDI